MNRGPGRIDWAGARARLDRAASERDAGGLSPEQAREVLDARAAALARVPEQPPESSEVIEVAIFRLADERYALETRFVRRVERLGELTPIPGTPDALSGVVNSQGEVLAVFDLRPLLGIERRERSDQTRIMVIGGGDGDEFGLLADEAREVVTLRHARLFPPPGSAEGFGRVAVRGTTRDGLTVLDGEALLRDDRLVINSGDDPGA